MRRPVRRSQGPGASLVAPVLGLVTAQPVASPAPQTAEWLENFLPTSRGIQVRGGTSRAAFVTDAVKTLFSYTDASSPKFFAATADAIYDISGFNATTAPAQSVSGLTSGDWSTQQFGTSGGDYLVCANGADFLQVWDGSTWHPIADEVVRNLAYDGLTADFAVGETVTGSTSGASAEILGVIRSTATTGTLKIGTITGGPFQDDEAITSATGAAVANGADVVGSSFTVSGVTTSNLSHVWTFKNRLFYVQKDTLTAWYAPSGAIGGAYGDLSLAGIFKLGGSLLTGASWSLDAGDGPDDKCVFISTEGEVAIYGGTDPSDATLWSLEGRYDIGKPLGKRALMQVGGDLYVATTDGIVPISAAINKDPAQITLAAITAPIETLWEEELTRTTSDVELVKWTDQNILAVILPNADRMLTANLQTGGWAVQSGWSATCAATYDGDLYLGRSSGRVFKANDTGQDDGASFTARVSWPFLDGGNPALYKTGQLARIAGFADAAFVFKLEMMWDNFVNFSSAPAIETIFDSTFLIWGTGRWGDDRWGRTVSQPRGGYISQWQSVYGGGYSFAPALQIVSRAMDKLSVEITRIDFIVEGGGRAS